VISGLDEPLWSESKINGKNGKKKADFDPTAVMRLEIKKHISHTRHESQSFPT